MKTIYITIGISGSGKSTYVDNNAKSDDIVICPDDIRKELTGSVSDQSKNVQVFETAYNRLVDALAGEADIWWSATNLSTSSIDKLITCVKNAPRSWNVTFIFFEDSLDWQLCQSRVSKDIENGVDRSNTSDVMVDRIFKDPSSGKIPLIQSMSERYREIKNVSSCILNECMYSANTGVVKAIYHK